MGNWFKRKSQPETSEVRDPHGPLIAMLLMKHEGFPFEAFAKLLAGERICGRKITIAQAKDNIYSFNLDVGFGAFAEIPAPVPWTDLEGPCATSWLWPHQTPADSIRAHRTHILVTIMKDNMDPVARRLLLTQIMGMASHNECVMGVYWPEGTLVHHPGMFSEMASALPSPEAPPLYLWVDYRVFRNDDYTFGMFTTGMRALGLMDMEIPKIDMEPGELREWAMNLTLYQLDNGPVLKDGETIGRTQTPEFYIRYRPSKFGHKETILAIEK